MLVNAVLFGVVVALLWLGFKILWAKGPIMRVIVLVLSAPILIFMGMIILDIVKN